MSLINGSNPYGGLPKALPLDVYKQVFREADQIGLTSARADYLGDAHVTKQELTQLITSLQNEPVFEQRVLATSLQFERERELMGPPEPTFSIDPNFDFSPEALVKKRTDDRPKLLQAAKNLLKYFTHVAQAPAAQGNKNGQPTNNTTIEAREIMHLAKIDFNNQDISERDWGGLIPNEGSSLEISSDNFDNTNTGGLTIIDPDPIALDFPEDLPLPLPDKPSTTIIDY